MSKNLVIVESPAKAKTIEKYLGKDFKVLASIGHIRKDTKVNKETFEVTYEIDPEHEKIIAELKKASKAAEKVWLATDEDREGESISWHLQQVLKLPADTARITFHEITKSALEQAIQNPRTVDMNMVASQQARQTLDMIVGFDLSDVVRRKVPGAISAGRVQSPALRLVVEREKEIHDFSSSSTFKITGDFGFNTALNHQFEDEKSTEEFLKSLIGAEFSVASVSKTQGEKSAPVPFTTASLQIEANSRLGMSTRATMTAAQGLYQAGLITYHRTDSLNLSAVATASISKFIEENFGNEYLHRRTFKTKNASAQEAHEAIRPTDISNENAGKTDAEKRLYRLIRTRTLATQMSNARVAKTAVKISSPATDYLFEGKGEVVIFDGFLKVYGNAKDSLLPELQENQPIAPNEITARQHFPTPPARYTEGSLVKKLEELGIGRPSTYASIMTAIQARGYVALGDSEGSPREVILLKLNNDNITRSLDTERHGANKGKLLPTAVGELVAGFLVENFLNIVDYQFTANIEKELDQIAEAQLEKVSMLQNFYTPFSQLIKKSADLARYNNARLLGTDPKSGKNVYVKVGRTGGYVQIGENENDGGGEKPVFASLQKGQTIDSLTLDTALELFRLPAHLGEFEGAEITVAVGRFGPYVKHNGTFTSIPKGEDPLSVTFDRAVELILAKRKADKEKLIQSFDNEGIQVLNGRFGPYISKDKKNYKIPKTTDPKTLTLEDCQKLIAEQGEKPTKSVARKTTKTTKKTTKTATKSTAKKSTRKKS